MIGGWELRLLPAPQLARQPAAWGVGCMLLWEAAVTSHSRRTELDAATACLCWLYHAGWLGGGRTVAQACPRPASLAVSGRAALAARSNQPPKSTLCRASQARGLPPLLAPKSTCRCRCCSRSADGRAGGPAAAAPPLARAKGAATRTRPRPLALLARRCLSPCWHFGHSGTLPILVGPPTGLAAMAAAMAWPPAHSAWAATLARLLPPPGPA